MRPLTPKEIVAALDKWHVPYVLVSGWETRDNGSHWSDKTSVTGCMYHHTAGDAADNLELAVIKNGRTGLRGPLANFGAGDDGVLDVVAAGSANHAGKGDPKTLTMVQRETTPLDRDIRPTISSADASSVGGNSRFYGWESYYGIRNDPTPNPKQHRVVVLSMCAIIDALDTIDKDNAWTGKAAIGHREWTRAKIDPSAVKMFEVRNDINMLRKAGPAAAKVWYDTGKLPSGPTPPSTGGTVTIAPAYRGTAPAQDVVKAFLASDVFGAPDRSTTNPYWSGASWFKYVGYYTREGLLTSVAVKEEVKALRTEVAALTALVQTLVAKYGTEPTP